MITDLESAIKHCEEVAERLEGKDGYAYTDSTCDECAKEHRQLAEWLKKLLAYESFADWLVEAVLEEDWEDDSDFYTEVLCRKLTKLGKLKVVDNKYMEVNTNERV